MNFKRFAVIADIHGNSDALAAVLADIDALRIETIVNLGDHLSGPLAARETADMLMAREMISIRGNHDRWLVEKPFDEMGASDRAARGQLDDNHLAWLRALPATRTLDEGRIFACHGTPASDMTFWAETLTADGNVVLRPRSEIAAEAVGMNASFYLCGHSHLPHAIRFGEGHLLVNPGSVGCPGYRDDRPMPYIVQTGNPDARYAIIEQGEAGWQVTLRSIPYDAARMAGMAEDAGRADWAEVVRTGWMSG